MFSASERGRSIWLAVLLTLILVLWMASGQWLRSEPEPTTVEPASAPLMRVGVRELTATTIHQEQVVQGQLKPLRRLEIRAETQGMVTELPLARGARAKAGAVLVQLAEEDRPAQLARAEAEVASQELIVAGQQRLKTEGLQAETQLQNALAALAAARAERERVRLDLERTRIRAPFDGILEARPLELGSLVERGDLVAKWVDDTQLLAVAHVAQRHIERLHLGQVVRARLLDGREIEGSLTYLARVAAPGTRSFRIEAQVPNPDRQLPAGMSLTLRIELDPVDAHFISPAALTLNDQGQLGVKTVDDQQRVQFYPIERLRAEADGWWVGGLPSPLRLIVQGQGFVIPGEQVEPVTLPTTLTQDSGQSG